MAANLDGATARWAPRPDAAAPAPPGKDAATWWLNPRLPRAAQAGQDHLTRAPDFIHMVSRLDILWGSDEALQRANVDAFHLTNSIVAFPALEVSMWLELEASLQQEAIRYGRRQSTFSGPLLELAAPSSSRRSPLGYWKVVAHARGARLSARAFLLGLRGRFERGQDDYPPRLGLWQVTVADLEKLVELDFGPLRAADVFNEPPDPLVSPADGALAPPLLSQRLA